MATTQDGEVIEGESNITKAGKQIKTIKYKNKVHATPMVLEAIKNADLIIIGIGSLYTSIIPNLLTREMKKVLKDSKAKKMYICNIMSEHGETDGYQVSDCIKQINKYEIRFLQRKKRLTTEKIANYIGVSLETYYKFLYYQAIPENEYKKLNELLRS